MDQRLMIKISKIGVVCLKSFAVTVSLIFICGLISAFYMLPQSWALWLAWVLPLAALEFLLFWMGIILVYVSSVQLGIKIRVLGAVFGMVPVVNIFFLLKIIKTVSEEVRFETDKLNLNEARRAEQLCKTKYPILMVHGVFFRDYKFPGYWGRIPKELEANGAEIYFGNQQSAASVADSGRELAERIKEIRKISGADKVNVIAHSKGGLDIREAVKEQDAGDMVASITTINTPHRGCEFAEYLLEKLPVKIQKKIEASYNKTMRRLGDEAPDFMAAVRDLTAKACAGRFSDSDIPKGILCRSVGSKLNKAAGGKFPLNFTYNMVKYFDGPNDGLVSESSFKWGEEYIFLTAEGSRGISHGDVIDLNRENIQGFDVREFYVGLVAELKSKGL